MEENLAAALCYIPIIGLIFLVLEPYNKNRTIRFHAFQSLFYMLAWFVISVGLGVIGTVIISTSFGLWTVWALIRSLISLALLAILVYLAVQAYQRKKILLPVIGPLADKQASAA